MNGKVLLFGRPRQDDFGFLLHRQMRKQRRNDRQLAEQCTTKHQLEARKSCVADARSYRVARQFPLSAIGHLDWKNLIPASWPKFGSDWFNKFREHQLRRLLNTKISRRAIALWARTRTAGSTRYFRGT
jgi:hypothetical protein